MGLIWPFSWPLASDSKVKVDFAKTVTECLLVQEIAIGTEYHDSIFAPESQPQEYQQPYVSCVDVKVPDRWPEVAEEHYCQLSALITQVCTE